MYRAANSQMNLDNELIYSLIQSSYVHPDCTCELLGAAELKSALDHFQFLGLNLLLSSSLSRMMHYILNSVNNSESFQCL